MGKVTLDKGGKAGKPAALPRMVQNGSVNSSGLLQSVAYRGCQVSGCRGWGPRSCPRWWQRQQGVTLATAAIWLALPETAGRGSMFAGAILHTGSAIPMHVYSEENLTVLNVASSPESE